MSVTPLPFNESERLLALKNYQILDSPSEELFDRIVALAARIFNVPVALINLIDQERYWFKACYGLDASTPRQGARQLSICSHTILTDEFLYVPDAQNDPRFADYPTVTGDPGVRFYAGVPLHTSEGYNLGTICLLDWQPRSFSKEEQANLEDLAIIITKQIEARLVAINLTETTNEHKAAITALVQSEERLRSLVQYSSDIITLIDAEGIYRYVSASVVKILGYQPEALLGCVSSELIHPEDLSTVEAAFDTILTNPREPVFFEFRYRRADNEWVYFEAAGSNHLDNPGVNGIVINARDITVRKQVEQQLRLLERAVAESTTGILITDATLPDNPVVYVNPAFESITGYKVEEVLGHNCRFLQGAERNQPGLQELKAALDEKREIQLTLHNYHKNGSAFWNELKISPVRNSKGQVTHFIGIQTDITNRRQAEDLLSAQNNVLELLARGRSQTEILNELTLTIEKQSDGMLCSILLLNENRLWAETAPSLAASYIEAINGVAIGPKVGSCGTAAYLRKPVIVTDIAKDPLWEDYRELALSEGLKACWSQPILSSAGKVLGTFAMYYREPRQPNSHDLHLIEVATHIAGIAIESKQSEAALKRSEEQFRLIFELAPTGMALVGLDGRLLQVNPAVCKLLGYSSEQLLSLKFNDITHPEDLLLTIEQNKSLLNGEIASYQVEKRYLRRDGRVVNVILQVGMVKDAQGQPLHLISQVVDITEQQRATEELLKTSKLESLGLLAGGIAHDFNNILTAILGNLSLARSFVEGESELPQVLEEAQQACVQARDLTRQLLTFARGGAPIKETALLPQLIQDSARFAARGSGVQCLFDIAEDIWPVEVDKGQLSQVTQNLIINAVQAMPEGGVIRVQINNLAPEETAGLPLPRGNFVRIAVEDQGAGIAPEQLPKIFDPYFTTKERGTGLGLATCYSIIKKHDGYIQAKSKLGAGTTFEIYLPALAHDDVPGLTASLKERQNETEKAKILPSAKLHRVLLMDDEPMVSRAVSGLLRRLGYEVEVAWDGLETLESYQKAQAQGQPFEIVIMDLTIPGGMGGKETIKKLVELDPQVKAIVSSGYSENSLMAQYKDYGFKGMVAKPYTMRDLARVLEEVRNGN